MAVPREYSFQRYLRAKKSVDDRALNRQVWLEMQSALAESGASRSIRVLEVGAGIGTMLERALAWNLFQSGYYLGLDANLENIACAQDHFIPTSTDLSWQADFVRPPSALKIDFLEGDLLAFARSPDQKAQWDLLIAHAVLDLLDLDRALPLLLSLLKPGGCFYFSINFDGVSILEPVLDPELDEKILQLYHRSMDLREVGGHVTAGSRAGRKLFQALPSAGATILAAGSSDWVVYPQEGEYPHDEAYFLHHILHFFETSLASHPALEPDRFRTWLAARRSQVEQGVLVYVAHQLDFCGRKR